ncbi:MAG: hypothetical protein RBQ99_03370 [Trichlorobacter sp.]|nr:hypothetical protein [Trichlorobacter sp.]
MKSTTLKTGLAFLVASSSTAYAATSGAASEGSGLLVWFLIGFAALVVILQGIPAVVMFASMLKGLFGTQHQPKHHEIRR